MDVFDREINNGTRESRFRTGDQIRKHKIEKGGLSPATWFLKGEIGSTISCQATPGSRLATILQTKCSQGSSGVRKVVLEEGGNPASLGLKKRDPFSTRGCKFKDPECIFNPEEDCSLTYGCSIYHTLYQM